jgi:hypothetical protein
MVFTRSMGPVPQAPHAILLGGLLESLPEVFREFVLPKLDPVVGLLQSC